MRRLGQVDRLVTVARLIANADDFGLTAGVNRAILELHGAGVLTSATLMAGAAASEDAIRQALAQPSLGVGCHVVLVDGKPLLAQEHEIPHLAEAATGRLRPTLGRFLRWLAGLEDRTTARQRGEQIEAEALAQIRHLQQQGIRLTHLDAHKHVHMFPPVLRAVARAAHQAGIACIRNPFEPRWSIAATPEAAWLRRFEVSVLRHLESRFQAIVAEAGLTTTSGALGIAVTGSLTRQTVQRLVAALPSEGVYELVTHPGYSDADLARVRTRLLESREVEREALGALDGTDTELISFAALPQAHPAQ